MEMKLLTIKDDMTAIRVFAWRANGTNMGRPVDETERGILAEAGFGSHPDDQRALYVFLARMDGGRGDERGAMYDRFRWRNRTLWTAHTVLEDLAVWDALSTGGSFDVRDHPDVLAMFR